MSEEVKPWPAALTRILGNLVETRAGGRATSTPTEGGPPIMRRTGPTFLVLQGEATLSDPEWTALNSTREGRFGVDWQGQRRMVRLAPDSISPGNPRVLSSEQVFDGTTQSHTRRVAFDLLLLTPVPSDQ